MYLDDIVIHAKVSEEHDRLLRRVMEILREKKLKVKIQLKKDREEVNWEEEGKMIFRFKELQGFLRTANYHSRFIDRYGEKIKLWKIGQRNTRNGSRRSEKR